MKDCQILKIWRKNDYPSADDLLLIINNEDVGINDIINVFDKLKLRCEKRKNTKDMKDLIKDKIIISYDNTYFNFY